MRRIFKSQNIIKQSNKMLGCWNLSLIASRFKRYVEKLLKDAYLHLHVLLISTRPNKWLKQLF